MQMGIYGLLLFLLTLTACGSAPRLRLVTTTTTVDSGLMAHLLPLFYDQHGIHVDVIAVGTGEALALGQAGDADILLVHARELEEQFVADGFGTARYDVMANDFLLIGPIDDPAQLQNTTDIVEALQKIADTEALFVSRGDASGTHLREQALWAEAGIDPEGESWYTEAGQGMGATLTVAHEQLAYTLVDRGTYLAQRDRLALIIMLEGDGRLYNPYSLIPINPKTHPHVQADLAQTFVDWLTSKRGQRLINTYTLRGDQFFIGTVEN